MSVLMGGSPIWVRLGSYGEVGAFCSENLPKAEIPNRIGVGILSQRTQNTPRSEKRTGSERA